jgi:hypothetical protein
MVDAAATATFNLTCRLIRAEDRDDEPDVIYNALSDYYDLLRLRSGHLPTESAPDFVDDIFAGSRVTGDGYEHDPFRNWGWRMVSIRATWLLVY